MASQTCYPLQVLFERLLNVKCIYINSDWYTLTRYSIKKTCKKGDFLYISEQTITILVMPEIFKPHYKQLELVDAGNHLHKPS